MIGRVLAGRFRLEHLLGSGGMGHVYRAHHLGLDRPAAVKVLHAHVAATPGAAERFEREAKILARLRHPRCVQVYDAGEDQGTFYIAMELIDGVPLDLLLFDDGVLDPSRAVKLFSHALDALEHAHALGIVHRDLKPSNLFVQDRGREGESLKVVDFGVALLQAPGPRMTAEGKVFGTPAYMAPEQCQGRDIDSRADLYALGCALHEVLTGQPPFPDGGHAEVMAAQLYQPPPPLRSLRPELPAALEAAVLRALAKLPGERFQTAAVMRAALGESLAAQGPTKARGEGKKVARGAASEIVLSPARLQGGAPVGLFAGPGADQAVATALGAAGIDVRRGAPEDDLSALGALVLLPSPGDDGLALAAALAARADAPPLLLCGPEDDLDRMARAIQVGVYDYVSLPVDPTELVRKVGRALRRRR